MNSKIEELINNLKKLGADIENNFNEDRALNEVWGWNQPPINRLELSSMILNLSNKIEIYSPDELSDDQLNIVSLILSRIDGFNRHTLPQFYNGGNSNQAVPQYIVLLDWIWSMFEANFSIKNIPYNVKDVTDLSRKWTYVKRTIESITDEQQDIEQKIARINSVNQVADNLQIDLELLEDAKKKIEAIDKKVLEDKSSIEKSKEQIDSNLKIIQQQEIEAKKLIELCEDAYRITTTKGLAGAFDIRAKSLNQSLYIWVVGLLISLIIGVMVGASRFDKIAQLMSSGSPQLPVLWINLVLALLSVGGPIWFAWIATKQISQRFRLSEDYAFKASVAKAYEGYRKEAARLDEKLEARLFSSALTRLEEAPLRLMERDTHGSPFSELIEKMNLSKKLDKVIIEKAGLTNNVKNIDEEN